jgi:hypothetical protein
MLTGLPTEYLTKYTAEPDGTHCLPDNVETGFTTSVYQTSGQATCSGIIINCQPKLEDMPPWFQSSSGIPMVTYQPDTGIRPIIYNAADQRYTLKDCRARMSSETPSYLMPDHLEMEERDREHSWDELYGKAGKVVWALRIQPDRLPKTTTPFSSLNLQIPKHAAYYSRD